MEKLIRVIKDFIKCIFIGSCISFGIIVIVGIISLLVSKFDWRQSLEVVRSAILIIGSLGIVLGALLILKKRKEKELQFKEQWQKKYSIFSYRIVVIVDSFVIILYGGVIDWLIMSFIH